MRPVRHATRALAVLALLAVPAAGADITVTTTADGITADNQCTLREAVNAARLAAPVFGCAAGTPGPDTVVLAAGTYTIGLPGYEDGNQSGDLDVGTGQDLRILGAGPGTTIIDADGLDRVFDVPATTVLALEGLTLRNGRPEAGAFGGAVRNAGRLVTRRVTFTANRSGLPPAAAPGAPGDTGPGGGAISSSGGTAQLVVQDSTFEGNRSSNGGQGAPGGRGGDGGAILVLGGTATVHASTFTGNLAGNGGPGADVAVEGGQGANGGAIAVFGGTVFVVNSTFSANRAGEPGQGNGNGGGGAGGAIAGGLGPNAVTSVTHATFSGNQRGTGSSGGNSVIGLTLAGSLLADAAPACAFVIPDPPNLVAPGDTSCGLGAIQGDAVLGPLADNGGPTRTMLPGDGGRAIDLTPVCPGAFPFGLVDQRGVLRPQRGGCDVGAVEVAPPPPLPVINPAPAPPIIPSGASAAVLGNLRILPASARPGARRNVVFRLSDPARLVVTVRRTVTGRRVGVRCVAVRRAPRSAPRCNRTVSLSGSIARAFPGGPGRLRFSGRIGNATLPPGAYILAVRVVGGATTLRGFRVSE